MRFKDFLLTEQSIGSFVNSSIDVLKRMSYDRVIPFLANKWIQFAKRYANHESDLLKLINKEFNTHYNSFTQISRRKVDESVQINETFKDWFHDLKSDAIPSLTFFPMLQTFLEINNFIAGEGDPKLLSFYALMYVGVVSGKYISKHDKKKKSGSRRPFKYKPNH